jgi:hypothetical protein
LCPAVIRIFLVQIIKTALDLQWFDEGVCGNEWRKSEGQKDCPYDGLEKCRRY